MKEYTQADWDEYAEWAAEAAKVPYEELDAPWIVVNRGPDDIHPARSKWEAYQIAKSLNYSFESFLMVNPDTALESWATPWRREEKDEHKVSCTDEMVTKSFGTYPGTVARCTCGWVSSWTIRDGSAEADGSRHIRYKKKGQTND